MLILCVCSKHKLDLKRQALKLGKKKLRSVEDPFQAGTAHVQRIGLQCIGFNYSLNDQLLQLKKQGGPYRLIEIIIPLLISNFNSW
jgi:hypothetical protein